MPHVGSAWRKAWYRCMPKIVSRSSKCFYVHGNKSLASKNFVIFVCKIIVRVIKHFSTLNLICRIGTTSLKIHLQEHLLFFVIMQRF